MSSIQSKQTFSAYYAHKRALRNVQLHSHKIPDETCKICNGTTEVKINITTLDTDNTQKIQTIKCVSCKDGISDKYKKLYSSLIWCNCKNKHISGHIFATDGKHIFGKDTYLCNHCGFVKQFG